MKAGEAIEEKETQERDEKRKERQRGGRKSM